MDKIKDRMFGCLYGQAIGDALGLGSEFMNKDEVRKTYPNGLCKYDQIIQDPHRRRWPIGAWTDDTEVTSIPRYYIENLNNRVMYHQKITSFINQIIDENA